MLNDIKAVGLISGKKCDLSGLHGEGVELPVDV